MVNSFRINWNRLVNKLLDSLLVNKLLDSLAPIEARSRARLSYRSWLSYQTSKVLQVSGVRNRSWINRLFERAMQPDGWLLSLMFALTIIGLPQLIIFIVSPVTIPKLHSLSDYSIATILNTAWQVLGAIIALSLAIIVYLSQFIHDRRYERRAFPLFLLVYKNDVYCYFRITVGA